MHLGVGLAGIAAGAAIAIFASIELLLVIALELAQPFFLAADFTPAILVAFGLAGGRQIDALADDPHRGGGDIERGLGQTTAQRDRQQADTQTALMVQVARPFTVTSPEPMILASTLPSEANSAAPDPAMATSALPTVRSAMSERPEPTSDSSRLSALPPAS